MASCQVLALDISAPPAARGPAIEVLDYHTAGEPFRYVNCYYCQWCVYVIVYIPFTISRLINSCPIPRVMDRIIVSGYPELVGRSILERRRCAIGITVTFILIAFLKCSESLNSYSAARCLA